MAKVFEVTLSVSLISFSYSVHLNALFLYTRQHCFYIKVKTHILCHFKATVQTIPFMATRYS